MPKKSQELPDSEDTLIGSKSSSCYHDLAPCASTLLQQTLQYSHMHLQHGNSLKCIQKTKIQLSQALEPNDT